MGLLSVFRTQAPQGWVAGQATYLRHPQPADYDAWKNLRLQSRAFLEPWEPAWQADDHQPGAYRQRLRRYEDLIEADLAYPFFVFERASNRLLGGVTLSNVRRGVADAATLGYWVGAPHAGKGYMTDALRALTAHAFSALSLHRVEAACLPRNEPSIRLLERCGFAREGYAHSYLKIAGVWEDHLLWALLAGR